MGVIGQRLSWRAGCQRTNAVVCGCADLEVTLQVTAAGHGCRALSGSLAMKDVGRDSGGGHIGEKDEVAPTAGTCSPAARLSRIFSNRGIAGAAVDRLASQDGRPPVSATRAADM